ncbi:hypothetical protein V8F20_011876 [Naviculisporaceae sp. PSN 640]
MFPLTSAASFPSLLVFLLFTSTVTCTILVHSTPYHPYSAHSFPVLPRQTTRGNNSSPNNSTNNDGGRGRRYQETCESEYLANRFLSNGTFCSTVVPEIQGNETDFPPEITCPGDVKAHYCLALSSCFLPAGLNTPPHTIQDILANASNPSQNQTAESSAPKGDCSSQVNILTVLAVINIVEAASNLIQGHDRVRSQLARFRDIVRFRPKEEGKGIIPGNPESWTPMAGVLSGLTTFFFQVLLPAIGSWTENKDRGFSFGGLLGMWILRPRGAFPMFILIRLVGWGGFKSTLFDAIVTESILDLVALPWALTFVLTKREGNADGPKGCGVQGYEPPGNEDMRLKLAYSSFGWSTFAGVISCLVLAQFVIMSFNKGDSLRPENLKEKDEEEAEDDRIKGRRGWFWRRMVYREKRQLVPMVVAMGTFISNWVLWGQFTSLQGSNYCEGAGGVATLAISIIHQILIPLLRACFGVVEQRG